ncbi:MAG: GNAT family N-acetyltransferase [Defluviitaleaceae bacterium]|nr:GNAT family N-acetyltransferase [Defluviitaleaceae bacterium]
MIILESNRLIMRYYRDTDITEYHKAMSDRVNMYYFIPFGFVTGSIAESQVSLKNAIEYNASGQGYRFCIALKETDKLIGGIGYHIADETPIGRIADPMGWFIMPEHQNKGYVTEAARRVLEFAFYQNDCIRVVTACFAENNPTAGL